MTTTAQDREINERIAREHPHMRPVLKPTNVCVYEGGPAVTVRTGKVGNRYGLCADCRDATDRTDTAVRIMEPFRVKAWEAGLLDEVMEQFINEVILFASVAEDPEAAIDSVFRMLAEKRGGASRV